MTPRPRVRLASARAERLVTVPANTVVYSDLVFVQEGQETAPVLPVAAFCREVVVALIRTLQIFLVVVTHLP